MPRSLPLRAAPWALMLGAACAAPRESAPPPPASLPPLPVEEVSSIYRPLAPSGGEGTVRDPLDGLASRERVTLSAAGVNVRTLLSALAEAAGVSLVLGPEVQGQLSVNLVDVPVVEALRAVLAEAGLAVVAGPPAPLWAPVVFYTLPVDIEEASVELIVARFGVSREVAEWIVATRVPR